MTAKPIPEGYHSLTPNLTVANGLEALDFYERAFGAEVVRKLVMGGKLMHSELRIGDSIFSRQRPVRGLRDRPRRKPDEPLSVSMLIYTEDVDALYDRAIDGRRDRASTAPPTSSTATAPAR